MALIQVYVRPQRKTINITLAVKLLKITAVFLLDGSSCKQNDGLFWYNFEIKVAKSNLSNSGCI